MRKETSVMVKKCANPGCCETSRDGRNGRIYQIDRRDSMPHAQQWQERGEAEHFWLCGKCSAKLSVKLLVDGSIALAEARSPPQPEYTLMRQEAQPSEYMPRILILDVEWKTLAFIEQLLQDSGFGAITSSSVVEAITLLATGHFDCFIVIDRPTQSHAAAALRAVANAQVHCESCFCWNVESVRQRCSAFVEQARRGNRGTDYRDDFFRNVPLQTGSVGRVKERRGSVV
jgi:hypothetical protein